MTSGFGVDVLALRGGIVAHTEDEVMPKQIRRMLWKFLPPLLFVITIVMSVVYLVNKPGKVTTAPTLPIDQFTERELWADGSDDIRGSHIRRNFYEADRDKYPDFGIVYHVINLESVAADQEGSAVKDAIAICRRQFSAAYTSEALLAWDNFGRHKNEWRNGVRVIPFRPKWVVVILDNRAKLPKSGVTKDEEISEAARTRMIEAGHIFPAHKVFDKTIPLDEVLALGSRDAVPLKFDFSNPVPAYQTIYSIIEKFEREQKSRSD